MKVSLEGERKSRQPYIAAGIVLLGAVRQDTFRG
jgi:hypothetical protein